MCIVPSLQSQQRATHHSTQSRLLHIWSGSFRVTCTHSRKYTHAHVNVGIKISTNIQQRTKYPDTRKHIISWLIMHSFTKALSCFACDLLAILHLVEVATSSADPALQLRDTGIAFCSTSSRIPQAQKAAELSISTYEGLIYQLEGLKCTAPFI